MKSLSKKLAMTLAVLLLLGMLPVSAMAGNPPAEPEVTEDTGTQAVAATADGEPVNGAIGSDPDADNNVVDPDANVDDPVDVPDDEPVDVPDDEPVDDPVDDPVDNPVDDPASPAESESEGNGEPENEGAVPPINMQLAGQNYAFSKLGFWIGEDYIPLYEDANAANGVAPLSLLPLEEHDLGTVDLSKDYLPGQLKSIKLEAVWTDKPADTKVVWCKSEYSSSNDGKYQALAADGSLDLSPINDGDTTLYLTLISGSNPGDQTDPSNEKYTLTLTLPSLRNLFSFKAFSAEGTEIAIQNTICMRASGVDYDFDYDLTVAAGTEINTDVTVQPIFDESQGMTLTSLCAVVDGTDVPLTDGKYTADYSRGYIIFKAVLERNGVSETHIFAVHIENYIYVHPICIAYENSTYYEETAHSYTSSYDENGNLRYVFRTTMSGELLLRAEASLTSGVTGASLVQKAVVGNYKNLEATKDLPDIKDQLFGSGYKAIYSLTVEFTVFDINGSVHNFSVETAPSAPSSSDYFSIYAVSTDEGGLYSYVFDGYEDKDDMLGIYKIVYLLNMDGTAVPDGTTIYPMFDVHDKATVFLGENTESGVKQESGKSPITFERGKVLEYTVLAEDDSYENYYVTFLTPASGAKLSVPGDNVHDNNYDEAEGVPSREIHLGDLEYLELYNMYNIDYDVSDIYYDILIANVGDAELTGLKVYLENAQNIQLDPYWTITDNSTGKLAPFSGDAIKTTINDEFVTYDYDLLANQAKIRLLPLYDADGNIVHGSISGYLVISSDNGGEVKIKLTGVAGIPSIVTETIVPGVKYVPYDTLIQSNSIGESDAVTFEFSCYNASAAGDAESAPPAGLEWHSNGELYGIPLAEGSYFLYADLYANNEDHTWLDSKTYTLDIATNTDDNVWGTSDEGYSVLNYIGNLGVGSGDVLDGTEHYILNSYAEETFRSEGLYETFMDFYLDGQKLTAGTDYTSTSGSTVITIMESTLRRAGEGTHTIAAEFHELKSADGLPHGTLKRTAQNYTMNPKAARNSIDMSVYVVDSAEKPLEGYTVIVHSTPKTGTTNKNGVVTFKDVEFGEHTITVTKDGSTLSRAFTLVSGDKTALNGSTVTAKPGSGIALTVRLDGGKLELLSAVTSNPVTGDEAPLAQFTAMALVSLYGLGAVGYAARKRKEKAN